MVMTMTAPSDATSARVSALLAAGLRKTSTRLEVLRVLDEAEAPVSHGDVADRLARSGVDRATIYRNLLSLTEAGLARRTDLGDHVWRFERVREDGVTKHGHPHFVCVDCGDVSCLEDVKVSFVGRGSPLARRGEIHVRGTCDDCATPKPARRAR